MIDGEFDQPDGRRDWVPVPVVDEHLARRLVDEQFPQWADLPITPVELSGVDNRTFRPGRQLMVRLPSAG